MDANKYGRLNLKKPRQSDDYAECSKYIVSKIEVIMNGAMDEGKNKIILNTNLKTGIPMENINKIAAPFVEAWALEVFTESLKDKNNGYDLINVEAGERLNMADIILQFRKSRRRSFVVVGNVDVKATSLDIYKSGKSPNITSFVRIRSAYVEDPDYIFIVLSIKHRVSSTRDSKTKMVMGIMDVVDFNVYDLKYISDSDISYNPALGTGQIQIRDIHYVTICLRSTWEFCNLLDRKFIASKKGFNQWLEYAKTNGWIK